TVAWEAGDVTLGAGAAVENVGVFDVQGDFWMRGSAEEEATLTNAAGGVLRKSGGAVLGSSNVDSWVRVVNEEGGVISAERGSLGFYLVEHRPGALVQGTARFWSGNTAPYAGDVAPGPGIATLEWDPVYNATATSTLFIELD